MNKETLIAILLGFGGGIIVAFLLITVPKKISPSDKSTIVPTKQADIKSNIPKEEKFVLDSPNDQLLVQGKTVDFTGEAYGNIQVLVSGPLSDKIATIDENGKFTAKMDVYEGENLFVINAIFPNGNILSEKRIIFATAESL